MSNSKSRPTLHSLNRKIEETREEIEARLVEVRQELDEGKNHTNYLEKEGKRRHNGISAQLSRYASAIKALETLYGTLMQELADVKSSENPIIAQSNLADLESINDRLGAFEGLDGKVRKLREDVSELQATVTSHDVRISNVEHVTETLQDGQRKHANRIFNLEQKFQEKAPWAALIVGIIAAAVTLWVRFTFISRETTQVLPDGGTILVPDPNFVFNTWMMAMAFGVIAAGLIVLLGLFVGRSRKGTDYEVSPSASVQVSNTPTPRQQPADEAPTKKLPATEQLVGASKDGA